MSLHSGLLFQETFVTTDEFGHDLEHVEVLQRKFDEFQKDMASQEYRVTEVNELADKLVLDGHPERDVILKRKEVLHYFMFLNIKLLLLILEYNFACLVWNCVQKIKK